MGPTKIILVSDEMDSGLFLERVKTALELAGIEIQTNQEQEMILEISRLPDPELDIAALDAIFHGPLKQRGSQLERKLRKQAFREVQRRHSMKRR